MKNKIKKTVGLIAVYVVLLIVEILYYVPYERIEIFRTKQNVPYTETTGNGYASISDISHDTAVIEGKEWTATGKRVDTSQLITNVSFTTLVFAALYFLLISKKATPASASADNIEGEQPSSFNNIDSNNIKEITVHTLSSKNGYYKDTIERNEENAPLIDKWLDKSTGCLYKTIMYKDGEAEILLVTKEFFDTLYKHFDL